jgi:hypothetical protein
MPVSFCAITSSIRQCDLLLRISTSDLLGGLGLIVLVAIAALQPLSNTLDTHASSLNNYLV